MNQNKGFTLIELMVVISIIGVLAAIAIPNFILYRDKSYICEGMLLFDSAKKNVSEYYDHRGIFPANNKEAGLPEPENIKGKYVESVTVVDGAITIRFYKESKVCKTFKGTAVTYRPAISIDNPTGHILWLSRKEEVPPDMAVYGEDYTDIDLF